MKGVNSNMMYLMYWKNICKCHNVFPANTRILKKFKRTNEKFSVYLCVFFGSMVDYLPSMCKAVSLITSTKS
jgi:hypothetical protein